ncbi:MAG TPA: FimV/HubP family polar landmark protein, partial [Woeseiaceae bacterium]
MSLRLNRAWLMLALLLAGNTFALGLGDIRLSSALNEPLRAEIALLSATPEELEGLKVELATAETFARYGLDRPLYLSRLQFAVVRSGRSDGNVVRITSQEPLTEPFVTLLVEAAWSSGRLLREYTLLLDPPTFAPPPTAQSSQAVQAPSRATPADSGQIQRTPPRETAAPAEPRAAEPRAGEPRAEPADTGTFDTSAGGDVQVQRGDTLWGIAQRVRPDNRLAINQVMLAIFEANPDAFAGNINRLTAGARLRIPSADDIFRINRGDALSEVQRHNSDFGIAQPASDTRPSLTLVPPDADQEDYTGPATRPGTDATADAALQTRIRELEAEVSEQSSLLEVRDNELAQLRQELQRMREQAGVAQPADPLPVDEPAVPADEPDEVFVEEDPEPAVDEPSPVVDEAEPEPVAERPAPRVVSTPAAEPGIVDRLIGLLTSIWGIIGLALIVAIVVLLWFARRAAGRDEESTGVWEALDS